MVNMGDGEELGVRNTVCNLAVLKLTILLPQSSKYWNYKHVPPHLASNISVIGYYQRLLMFFLTFKI